MSRRVVLSTEVRPQYWLAKLECGHTQEVHSVRESGPLYVKHCLDCERDFLDKK